MNHCRYGNKILIILLLFYGLLYSKNSFSQCSVAAGNDTTICQGLSFVRTAVVAPVGSQIQWYVQGNSTNILSTSATINTTLSASGVFNYIIKVSSGTGASACTKSDTVKVTVNPSPRVNAGSNQSTCQGSLFNLTAIVAPSSASINWNLLGELNSLGTNLSLLVPTSSAGTFDYVIKADSASTCSRFDTVRVVVNTKPVANFTFSINCGSKVVFTSTSSTTTGNITNYQWNFGANGNNNTSNQQNPIHIYSTTPATYQVQLIVTNSFGCKDTVTKSISTTTSPVAQLISNQQTTVIKGEDYFFACTSSDSTFTFFNNSINYISSSTYAINWGDGTSNNYNQTTFPAPASTLVPVTHNYLTGNYTLSFIMNNSGCIDSVRYKIYVGNIPAGGIVGLPASTICTGIQQGVIISGTASNTSGTIYTLTYNDNSAPITLIAPIPDPDTLFHSFLTSSCGTTSTTGGNSYVNAFGSYLDILSPCGNRSGSVVPIYVASAPVADFTYLPYDLICVGQTITFNNTSNAGQNNVNGTCTPGKVVWQVSPNTPGTRYAVTSGTLGTILTTNPSNWISGSDALNVRFDSAGVYTIKIIAANNQLCGNDTMIKTICVNPIPTAAFSLTPNSGCTPLSVNANGSTNIPTCGSNTYNWTVSYAPLIGCTPNVSDYAYVNGANSSSQNPQFSFVSPGVYTIELQTFSPNLRCSSAVVSQSVTVNSKPIISLSFPSDSICPPGTITPNFNSQCNVVGAIYNWTLTPGGTSSSSLSSSTPPLISYNPSNTDSIYNYSIGVSVQNSCGITNASETIVVKAIPRIPGRKDSVCTGNIATYSPNTNLPNIYVPTGTTYSWSVPTVTNGITGAQSGTAQTTFNSGTLVNSSSVPQTIIFSITPSYKGCVGAQFNDTFIVKPKASISSISSNICSSTSFLVTPSSANPNILPLGTTYTWTVQDNPSITGESNQSNPQTTISQTLTNTSTSVQTVVYTVTPKSNGCPGANFTVTVTVNPSPTAIASPQTICSGTNSNIAITTNVTPSPNVTFSWTVANNSNINGAANSSGNTIAQTLNNTSNTVQNLVYTIAPIFTSGSLSCAGISSTVALNVNPTPTVTAPNDLVLCNASSTGNINFTGSVTGTVYDWVNNTPSIGLAASGTGNISSFITTNSGTNPVTAIITVTPKFTNASTPPTCNGTSKTFNITVNPIPNVNQPSDLTICNNASSGLISFTGNVNGTIYEWTNSNTSIGLGSNGTGNISSFTGLNTGIAPITATITVTPKFTNSISATPTCSGPPKTFIITINPTPSTTANPTSQIICSGNVTSIALTSNIANNVTFNWVPSVNNLIVGATNSSGTSILQTLTNSGNSTQNITYTITPTYINNSVGCSGGVVNVVVTVNPAPVVNQPDNLTFCKNNSTGTIGFSGPVTGTIFSWTNDNTAIGLAACGTGDISSFTATNSTTSPIVANITVKPSFSNSGGGSSCLGVSKTFTITVNPIPVISVTPNTQIICSSGQTNIVLSSNISSGVSYSWTVSSNTLGATSSSGNIISQTLINSTFAPQDVTYSITPTFTGNSFACPGSIATAVITVNPIPNVNQPTSQTICNNVLTNAITFGTSLTGTTFTWTNNNVSIGLAANGTGNIPAFTATNVTNNPITGIIQVTPTYTNSNGGSACTGIVRDFNIVVNPTPTSIAPNNIELCNGSPTGLISLTGNVSGSIYNWTNNTTSIGLSAAGIGDILSFNAINSTSSPITATIIISPSFTYAGTTCSGNTSSFTIKIIPSPTLQFSQANQMICSGSSSSLVVISSATTGTTYTWSSSAPSSITGNTANGTSNNIPVQTLINSNATPQTVVYSVIGSTGGATACPGVATPYTIVVNPKPTIGQIELTTCSGVTFSTTPSPTLVGNIIPSGTSYNWSAPIVTGGMTGGVLGNGSTISGTLINTTSSAQTATYTVTPTSGAAGSCVGSEFTVKITVIPKPEISNITKTLCSDSSFNIVPVLGNIIPVGTTYSWAAPTLSVSGSITGGTSSGGQQTSITDTLVNTTNTVQTATYTVTPYGNPGSCAGVPFTLTVTLNPKPTISGIQQTICSDSSFSIVPSSAVSTNVIPAGTTYSWNLPTLSQTGSITGATTSSGQQDAITDTLVNTTITVQTATYTVTPYGNPGNCPGVPFTVTVTVNPKPTIKSVSYTICNGSLFSYKPSNNNIDSIVPAGTTYSWLAPTLSTVGGITGGLSGTNMTSVSGTLFNTTDNPQTATYTVTPYGPSGCKGNSFTVTVTVNPAPRIIFNPVGPQTICSGSSITSISISSPTVGANINWTCTPPSDIIGVQTFGTNIIPVQILQNNSANPITITYSAQANTSGTTACPGLSIPYNVIVNPTPKISNKNYNICSGTSFTVGLTNNPPVEIIPSGTTYTWTISNNTNITGASGQAIPTSTISQNLTNLTNIPQTIIYTINPTSGTQGNCIGSPFLVTVIVNPAPLFPSIHDTICSGRSFDKIPQNNPPLFIVPAGTQYSWGVPTMPLGAGPNLTSGTSGGVISGISQSHIFGTLNNTAYNPLNVVYSVTPSSGNNSGSCAGASFDYIVTVNPLPVISDTMLSQSICDSNYSAAVTMTSNTDNSTFEWALSSIATSITGQISMGNTTIPSMQLFNAGIARDSLLYQVITTSNSCSGPPVKYKIYVNPDATATYLYTVDTACWPFDIHITNTSPTTADSAYYWYANNTLIGTGYNFPGFTLISSDDSVLIRLITISRYGCKSDTIAHWFFTRHKPRPNFTFTYNPASGCGPSLVTFYNTTPYQDWFNYQWNFGTPPNPQTPAPNPINSSLANPESVLYQSNQLNFTDATYNVKLVVSNVCETAELLIPVIIRSLPKAQFAPNQTNVCSNTNVIFTNTSQGIGNSYHWDFGEGTQLNTTIGNQPVQHIYNVSDTTTFNVVLTATNSCGIDEDTVSIRVTPNTIDLNWYILQNTQFGCAPHQVEIHNISTGATLFEWNFNDPNSPNNYISGLNSEVIYHTYITPGNYNISVHAINSCSDTSGLDSVRVIRSPIPAFQVVNNNACPWTEVSFINETDTATAYTWNFGDTASGLSNTSHLLNPSHVYNSPGVYTVTLSATLVDITGITCPKSISHNVNIVAPIAQINSNPSGCIRDTILFTPVVNTSLGLAPIRDTIWQINGVPYTIPPERYPNFSHVFTEPGIYTITLIVGTIYDCYDTVSTSIIINTIPSIYASADQRICLGQSVSLSSNSNAGNYQWTPLSGLSCYTCSNPIASPVTTTNYVVSTLNDFGCRNTDTVLVIVIQPFDILVSPNDTICIGKNTTLSVSGATNYTWTPSTTLSCLSCPNPIATPQITTSYTVVGYDNYRCFTDTCKVEVAVGMYPIVSLPSPQILSTGTLFPIIQQITNGPIRNYIWTPNTDLDCSNCPSPTAFIRKDICYALEAENIYGCKGSDTFCIRVFCDNSQTFIPNTFTPDGDGFNDIFMVRAKGIKSVKQFRVFNRWGEIIFEKSNFSPNNPQFGWDGKIRGILATPDVFVYTAEVLCENDLSITYKGNVTLIR